MLPKITARNPFLLQNSKVPENRKKMDTKTAAQREYFGWYVRSFKFFAGYRFLPLAMSILIGATSSFSGMRQCVRV